VAKLAQDVRMPKQPTPHEIRAIAVAAQVDPHTVQRYFRGGNLRPSTRARIEAALKARKGGG
jgi:hypothetical protein